MIYIETATEKVFFNFIRSFRPISNAIKRPIQLERELDINENIDTNPPTTL